MNRAIFYEMFKKCKNCGKDFLVLVNRKNFCGYSCSNSYTKTKERNGRWTENPNSNYFNIHSWIKRRLSKPKMCENCKKIKKLDLANLNGKYLKKLSNWSWFCRKCHTLYDRNRPKFYEETK